MPDPYLYLIPILLSHLPDQRSVVAGVSAATVAAVCFGGNLREALPAQI